MWAMPAQAGDAVALSILRRSGERLGQALAMLIDVLNPQRIVLGGLAWRMGETLARAHAQSDRTRSLAANITGL